MSILNDIAQPIEDFRRDFEEAFTCSVTSDTPLIQEALEHISVTSGKHIRPLLLGLCAALCGGKPSERSVRSAVLLELLHSSSLIHDDVIDQSPLRRGRSTLNAIYDNHVAVLVGDYILSVAFMQATESGDEELMRIAASVGKQLSEGELQQIAAAQSSDITTEEEYIQIIEKKTAALFEAVALLGARSVDAPLELVMRCASIGKDLGFAFQIKDDIFDYSPLVNVGKPTGNDILEGKITIPLIHTYRQASERDKEYIREYIALAPTDEQALQQLMQMVTAANSLDYARELLLSYTSRAKEKICLFPDSPARRALLSMVDFLIERNY